jgi:quercetin dioxygenase-like cupin family protein
MHVTPSDLRILRQDRTVVRFALLDSMAFVLAEIGSAGSGGTSLERPCTNPHWGFVLAGDIAIEVDGSRQRILPGSAFHVPPDGRPHRFIAPGEARIAAFEPVDPVTDTSDTSLAARGFEIIGPDKVGAATLPPASIELLTDANAIDARFWSMSAFVLTRARFGPGSGYTSEWCDAAHLGLVMAGRLAIEWEHDIEILAAGDVYHCPGGPPGHRLEAADPATILDLTPLADFDGRLASWRSAPAEAAERIGLGAPIAVAGLG